MAVTDPPKNFHHPFEPYEIQQQFMEAVWSNIENGKVAILESPTGTGKSLSLLCGSLTWLRHHQRKAFDDSISSIELEEDEPEWVIQQVKEARQREMRQIREDIEARLEAVRQRENKIRKNAVEKPESNKRYKREDRKSRLEDTDEQFVLDDYESDNEVQRKGKLDSIYSNETLKLMERLHMLPSQSETDQHNVVVEDVKIFFCSRTHSQLSQLVGELQRIRLPSSLTPIPTQPGGPPKNETLKHVPLGSRKTLCINPKVTRLHSQTAVNERCIELQRKGISSDQKCPFIPTKDNENVALDFRDHTLAKIRDIEEMGIIGKTLQICPYYASRAVLPAAEMVTLPYPLLFQKSARDALGISLKGHIVIIDEAHNLIDALEGIHSIQVSETQLTNSRHALMIYLYKFRNRLKGKNRIYIAQVLRVIDSLLSCTAELKRKGEVGGTLSVEAMLSSKAADQINLAKLVQYITESKLARKVDGYTAHNREREDNQDDVSPMQDSHETPSIMHVQNFFGTLLNPSREGQFFWSRTGDSVVLRYLLLDPSEHFRDIVEDARAVILAGGTMSPMDDYKNRLFPYVEKVETLSLGHLIPRSSLLVRTIASDQMGPLKFTFRGRSGSGQSGRVGHVVLELFRCMCGGLVVFFPSYGYLEQVVNDWQTQSVMQKLEVYGPIFTDKRNGNADDIFRAYGDAIVTRSGRAVLLSVIGGKLSEGINFSDNLGRCVLVVGLPFPNLETPEWKAKLKYIGNKAATTGEIDEKARRDHAENVCMRSVNQAVGRVIRHKGDWASIVLMDDRYRQERIREKLPSWIRDCLPQSSKTELDAVVKEMREFFELKASKVM